MKIHFLPEDIWIEAQIGESILEAAKEPVFLYRQAAYWALVMPVKWNWRMAHLYVAVLIQYPLTIKEKLKYSPAAILLGRSLI